ncbi:putative quinol monooxygenase [Litoreibacter janthinus]|uniref:Quinol monooxygenase YgiN n=1 Tax=Litoreibacter janthinus TaxID=670154 RepID=A0A1I6GVF0_9RHOB|nr:putative quinol monooxygenase [Litoreibacter janthinus]SFR46224.1 Quinol monooxygenase YgiN [Litoreibacter janthinus]
MFAVVVTFQIAPDQLAQFMPAMLSNAQTSLSLEAGCKQFDVCTDPERAGEVFLYELYDDEASFNAHTSSTHYAEFQKAIDGMIVSKDVRFFQQVQQ